MNVRVLRRIEALADIPMMDVHWIHASTMRLWALERAVLEAAAELHQLPELGEQASHALADRRQLGAEGFVTHLIVDRSRAAAVLHRSAVGDLYTVVADFPDVIGFTILLHEGYVRRIEALVMGPGNLADIDLKSAQFTQPQRFGAAEVWMPLCPQSPIAPACISSDPQQSQGENPRD